MTTDTVAEGTPVDIFGLVGTVLDRKFRVEKLVAEGGFGVVYYGVHLTLEKPIAIKVLKTPPEFNDKARAQFIEKFALEGKTMARVSHPNIVQVLDFGASAMPSGDLAPWMVLEWLTGQTLEQLLLSRRGHGRFTPAEAVAILKPVFEALAYAHEEGIAHRDIKPANMMVVNNKRGSTLRLMDFGIAKLMEAGEGAGSGATRTRTTMNAFSPQYAAPEQISGTRTGPWTDVHALALILTEMLTDMAPYDGDDMTQLFGQILTPLRPTPSRRGIDVGALEPVIARGLALKPDERYKDAGEFLSAVEAALGAQVGSTTSAFRAITNGGVPVPSGVAPTGMVPIGSPTTLRGSAVSTGVHGEYVAPKSRVPMLVGLGALVLVGAIGGTMLLNRHDRVPPAAVGQPTHETSQASVAPAVPPPVLPVVVAPPPSVQPVAPVAPPIAAATDPAPANPARPANTQRAGGGANHAAHGNGGQHANGGGNHGRARHQAIELE